MLPDVVSYRRALHRIPELDRALPETLAFVDSVLAPLPCSVSAPTEGSRVCFFDAGKAETVAFRADLDALPVQEPEGLPFASCHPGKMHACGHDGHTAMLLALAERLSAIQERLTRNVLLVFQPAEETTGGAEELLKTGLFETYHVTRVFGLHLWPNLAEGQVFTRPGAMMARSNEVTVSVLGKSVHISRWEEGLDALTAGTEYLRRVYTRLASMLPASEPRVLRFGHMTSGTVRNAVSGETRLEGTLRTYRDETAETCRAILQDTARELSTETGCGFDVYLSHGYPAVWNNEALLSRIRDELEPHAPEALKAPALAADDFSFYQRYAPGIYFFLGIGQAAELHAPQFAFRDEIVLPKGAEFLERLALLS